MASAARDGAAALAASDALTALSAYTQALIEHPNSPDYFVQRSIAFTRLKPARHDLALKDAEYAVLLGYKRAKREKIQAAQQRRVVSLYGLGRYADAKYILTTMEKWRPADSKPAKMEGDMWMARIESKLNSVPESERLATTKERPEIELPPESKLEEQLKAQLNADGSYKFDQIADVDVTTATAPTSSVNGMTNLNSDNAASTTAQPTTAVLPKIRDEWYQNAQSVFITLYAKGVSKDTAEIDIKEDLLYVSFPHPTNPSSTFTFSLDPLFALIDPSQSKGAVMSTKIELTLRKVQQGQKWHSLEGTTALKSSVPKENTKDNAAKVAVMSSITNSQPTNATITSSTSAATSTANANAPSVAAVPAYPTSSRHGPKDWDKLANDLHAQSKSKKAGKSKSTTNKADAKSQTDADGGGSAPSSGDEAGEDIDSDFESGDAVDGFFKKLYAGADPDTRRAMMKSFYESNGTALSTNWSEVGKAPVEEVKSKSDS